MSEAINEGPLNEMSGEQAADFERLSGMASEPGAMGASPMGDAPEVAPRDKLAGELEGIGSMLIGMVGPALPSLRTIYTPEVIAAGAGCYADLCVKHGWLSGGLWGGEWKEELACALWTVPLMLAAYPGVKADVAALKERARAVRAKDVTPAGSAEGAQHSNSVVME